MGNSRSASFRRRAIVLIFVSLCASSCFRGVAERMERARAVERTAGALAGRIESPLAASFRAAGAIYPPREVLLLAFKKERLLELWARDDAGFRRIKSYPVLGASGGPGPKLREGDRQVPEGVYPITGLNPASAYYLALALGYPNDFDREMAARDGRSALGGDIHIHGGDFSTGCLAIGDAAIEELFLLAWRTGTKGMRVIIAPHTTPAPFVPPPHSPSWTVELYRRIRAEIDTLAAPARHGR